jgi:flagellar protein FliT
MPERDTMSHHKPIAPSALLRCYAALDGASQEMLEAARAGDWDDVCRLEGACAVLIARLQEIGNADALPAHEQPERMRILRRIVERDAEIRRLCEPLPAWLDAAGRTVVTGPVTLH